MNDRRPKLPQFARRKQRIAPWAIVGTALATMAGCQASTEPMPSADQSPPALVLGDSADSRTLTLPPIDCSHLSDLDLPPSPTEVASTVPPLSRATSNCPVVLTDCLAHNPFAVPAGLLPELPPADVPLFAEVTPEPLVHHSHSTERASANISAVTIQQFFSESLGEPPFEDCPARQLSESATPTASPPHHTEKLPEMPGQSLINGPAEPQPPAPPIVRVFALNYLSRSEVEAVLPTLLTPQGKLQFAASELENTGGQRNEVLVVDEPHAVHRVATYLAEVDRPPPHVLIEAHVLQVALTGQSWQGVNLLPLAVDLGGLPAAETAQHYAHFPVGRTPQVLDALQTTLGAQLLGSPELIVSSGRTAAAQLGANTHLAAAGVPLSHGVSLQVTPTVTTEGRVWLRIRPLILDGQVNLATGAPAQTAIETTVLLANGETFVIGGLVHQRDVEVRAKRRMLGDLPVIGARFQRCYLQPTRTEVLIVLTSRIVPEGFDLSAWQ